MIVVRPSFRGSTFALVADEVIVAGRLVAANPAGKAVLADATLDDHFPAIGVCTAVLGPQVVVQPMGPATVFAGLAPGTTYYLGMAGGVSAAPPVGAKVAQPTVQAYAATAGVLLTSSTVVLL